MIQARNFLISILIIAFQTHSSKIETIVNHISFLKPVLMETSAEKIIEIYRQKINQIFGYKLVNINSVLHIFQELSTLDSVDLPTTLQSTTDDELTSKMIQFLSKHPDMENMAGKFESFLQNVFNAVVAETGFTQNKFEEVLTPKLIIVIIEKFETSTHFKFGNNQKKEELLNNLIYARNQFFRNKDVTYAEFLQFHQNPFESVADILIPMTVFYLNEDFEKEEEKASKIAQLNEFVVKKFTFEHLKYFAYKIIDIGRNLITVDSKLYLLIIGGILQVFLRANTNQNIIFGKQVFLYFFSKEFGQPLPEEYKNFLVTKYKQENLKFSVENAKKYYPELIRLYTLDVLDASLGIEENFISTEDMRFIFINFHFFAPNFNPHLVPYMRSMTALFTHNKHFLTSFYELFNGLYDTVLLSGPYLVNRYQIEAWTQPGYLFNFLLDKLLNWETSMVSYIWQWQPNSKHFKVQIKTNYFFYKLVNLVTFYDQLKDKSFSFMKFEPKNDMLIHKFTLEPQYKQLLIKLKQNLFINTGFNYQRFSNTIIDKAQLLAYDKYQNERKLVIAGFSQ